MTEIGGIEQAYNKRLSAEGAFGITEGDVIEILEQRHKGEVCDAVCADILFAACRVEDESSSAYPSLHERMMMVFADAYLETKGVPSIKAEECRDLMCFLLTGYKGERQMQYSEQDKQSVYKQVVEYIKPSSFSDDTQQAQIAHKMIEFCVSLYKEQQRVIEVPLDKGWEEQQKEEYTTSRRRSEADTVQGNQEQTDEVERLKKALEEDIILVQIILTQRSISTIVLNEWVATAEEAIKSSDVERMQEAGGPLHHFLYIQTEHL